jgi:hypothetical protein
MKKKNRKLVLHSETVRTLRALDRIELAHAVGGADSPNAAENDPTQSAIKVSIHP